MSRWTAVRYRSRKKRVVTPGMIMTLRGVAAGTLGVCEIASQGGVVESRRKAFQHTLLFLCKVISAGALPLDLLRWLGCRLLCVCIKVTPCRYQQHSPIDAVHRLLKLYLFASTTDYVPPCVNEQCRTCLSRCRYMISQ